MLPLLGIFFVIAFPAGAAINPGGVLNFYISDDDLNTSHHGIDEIPTLGLLEFTINGISIQGPSKMIEIGQNSGIFLVRLNIPNTISDRHLQQGDTLVIKYNDESDVSGNPRTVSKSIAVTKHDIGFSTSAKNIRIG